MADMTVHFLQNNMTNGIEHLKDSVGEVPDDVAVNNLFPNGIAEPIKSWEAKKEAAAKIKQVQQEIDDALASALGKKPAAEPEDNKKKAGKHSR